MNSRWQALAREAAAAAEHMAIGATALARANYAQTAYYAQAFFSLSVGFERSGKLAFVVDHALDNAGSFPSRKALKEFSHDLTAVLANMAEIGARRGVAVTLPQSGIHQGIIGVLTDFATNVSRYYNLEVISGSAHQNAQDPIAAWSRRVTQPILDAHYTPTRRASDEERARLLDELVGPFTMIRHHAETGESIDSFYEGSRRTAATDFAKRWERLYVLQIARFIAEVLRELGFRAHQQGLQDVPYLSEFFAIFMNNDKYFRSRKTWSIYV